MRISPTSTKIGQWVNNLELIFLSILIPFSFFGVFVLKCMRVFVGCMYMSMLAYSPMWRIEQDVGGFCYCSLRLTALKH